MAKSKVLVFPNLIDSKTGKTLRVEVPWGTVNMRRMMKYRSNGSWAGRKLLTLLDIRTQKEKPTKPQAGTPAC